MHRLEHGVRGACRNRHGMLHTLRGLEIFVERLDLLEKALRVRCGKGVGIDTHEVLGAGSGVAVQHISVHVQDFDRQATRTGDIDRQHVTRIRRKPKDDRIAGRSNKQPLCQGLRQAG